MGGRRTDTSELSVEKNLLLKRAYFNGEITMTKRKINTWQICLVALAVGINIVGGQIALFLKLPVYLDSIGTILTGALAGPWLGMIPNLISGIFMGMTVDIYSLYFAPVGMITGFVSGWIFRKMSVKKGVDPSGGCGYHRSGNNCKRTDQRGAVRWSDVFGVFTSGPASGQNAAGSYGKYICSAVLYRLSGQMYLCFSGKYLHSVAGK